MLCCPLRTKIVEAFHGILTDFLRSAIFRMVLLVWNLLVFLAFHRTPTAASAHLGLQTDGAITRLFKNIALYALFKIVGPHLEGTVA